MIRKKDVECFADDAKHHLFLLMIESKISNGLFPNHSPDKLDSSIKTALYKNVFVTDLYVAFKELFVNIVDF